MHARQPPGSYSPALSTLGSRPAPAAGSGKTSIIDCLAGALTELGNKHVIWRMNPKAITAPQMFGRMDAATGGRAGGRAVALWGRVQGAVAAPLLGVGATGRTGACIDARPPRQQDPALQHQ